ncbi:MAG TPA: YceD family protein [Paucimonas sp.]|nr:YceD family protein [Paucimonas sp.]
MSADTADKSGAIKWSLQGGRDGHGHSQLTLSVSGTVKLMCQRCLTPFSFDVDSEVVLVLAPDEESIDAIETLIDDESVDVIAGSQAMSVIDLIEDEVLLSLPLSPKHEVCPDQEALEALRKTDKESPFAVLKNLKQ